MQIENSKTKSIKILTNADTITFTNDTTGTVNVTEVTKGEYSVTANRLGNVTIPFVLTKGSKTQNVDVSIEVVATGSLANELFNVPKVIDLITTNEAIKFTAELETRYDDTTLADNAKPARVKDTKTKINIANNKLTLTPGKYWNKQDGLLKINAIMGANTEKLECPISLNYDNRSLRDFGVSNFIRECGDDSYTEPFKYTLDGVSKTGADIASDGVTVKGVNANASVDASGNLVSDPTSNPKQGASGGKAEYTASIQDSATQEGFDIDFDVEVGPFYVNNTRSVDPNLNITSFPTTPLTPDNPDATIEYTDRAVGSNYIISLDPEIAYVTHEWPAATSDDRKNVDQRTGGMPYNGTITVHGRKNGIARIAFIAQSASCSKAMTIKCIKCVGFPETVDADKLRRPTSKDKYFVLACFGQSNMTGFADNGYSDDEYYRDRRLAQLGYWGDNLEPDFLRPWVETSDDQVYNRGMYCGRGTHNGRLGVHFLLAKKILDSIPEDYGLLIVPVSHGNSAMIGDNNNIDTVVEYDETALRLTGTKAVQTRTTPAKLWKKGGNLQKMAMGRLKAALALNPENRFLGLVWCQGETDSASYTDNHVNNWGNQFKVFIQEMEKELKDVTMFNGTKGYQFEKHSFAFRGFYGGTCNWPKYPSMMALQKSYFGASRYFEYPNQPTTAEYRNAANNHHGIGAYRDISTAVAGFMKTQYGDRFDKVDIASDGIDLAASLPVAYYYLLTGSNASFVSGPTTDVKYLYPSTNIPEDEISVKYDKNGIVDYNPITGAYVLLDATKSSELPVVATIKRKATDVATITFGTTMTNIYINYESNEASSSLASYVPYTLSSANGVVFDTNMNAKSITLTTSGSINSVTFLDSSLVTVSNNGGNITITPVSVGKTYVVVNLSQSGYEATEVLIPVEVKFGVTGKYFNMTAAHSSGWGGNYLIATAAGNKKTYFELDTDIPVDQIVIQNASEIDPYVTFDFANKCFTYKASPSGNVASGAILTYNGMVIGVATVCYSSSGSGNKETIINV